MAPAASGRDGLDAGGSLAHRQERGWRRSRVRAAAPSLLPAAGQSASTGDGCHSHPRPPAPRATWLLYQAGQPAHLLYGLERKGEEESSNAGRNIVAGCRVGSLGSWRGAITQPPLSARCYVNGLGCLPRRGLSPRQRRPFRPPRAAGIAGRGSPAQPAPPRQRCCFTS